MIRTYDDLVGNFGFQIIVHPFQIISYIQPNFNFALFFWKKTHINTKIIILSQYTFFRRNKFIIFKNVLKRFQHFAMKFFIL